MAQERAVRSAQSGAQGLHATRCSSASATRPSSRRIPGQAEPRSAHLGSETGVDTGPRPPGERLVSRAAG